jgi:hypothetical protein
VMGCVLWLEGLAVDCARARPVVESAPVSERFVVSCWD